jgi:hypothetical protein
MSYSVFSEEQIKEAFEKVQNPEDWRAPIDAEVSADEEELVIEAIGYYTATQVKSTELANGNIRVESVGYRMGPAGP